MNKLLEYFAKSEDFLKAIIIMFVVGAITSFIGSLIIALVSLIPLMVFGGIIAGSGVIFLLIAFIALISYLGDM